MRKFLAVVKREYLKLVWTKAFIIGTLLAPLLMLGVGLIPALIFSIEGEAARVAVVDLSGKLAPQIKNALVNNRRGQPPTREAVEQQMTASQEERARQAAEQMSAKFTVEEILGAGKSIEEFKRELDVRLRENKLDAYVIVPRDFDTESFELYARNTSDFIAQSRIERALNQAVRAARLEAAQIPQSRLDEINREIKLKSVRVSESGASEDGGESFWLVFGVGFLIYLVLAIYGQAILAAVIEEKETKIAEILFSSARPFTLMIGKLVGVGLTALTQLAIWVFSAVALIVFGLSQMRSSGVNLNLPPISPFFILGLFVFFLLGFFTYATIYALIGSMVTTVQEGGQFALPPVMILLGAFYCVIPITRNPNSDFAVWTSLAPFLSPIVMPARMAIQMPPIWQVLFSMILSLLTILALTWLASRVYRIGMLMYGKRASIPEVLRWIRQS